LQHSHCAIADQQVLGDIGVIQVETGLACGETAKVCLTREERFPEAHGQQMCPS